MNSVALIRNPNSTGNLAAGTGRPAAFPSAVQVIDSSSLDDLTLRLAEAREAGAEIVLIDGGDGTVREVLSRLPEVWGTALPQVGILPRGNTNLIAREVGGLSSPDAVAEILRRRAAGAPLPARKAPVLRVDYPAGERPSLRGFMLGWGAYATGTRIAREEIAARGPRQVGLTLLSTLRRALFGAERAALRRGVATRLAIDGAAIDDRARLLGLVTTLKRPLVGGMNPFWGEGAGPMRWLDVRAPAPWLALATPFVLMGRPRRWMAGAGYASGRASTIELALDSPFIMDGDLFPPPARGPLRLSAAEAVSFLSLWAGTACPTAPDGSTAPHNQRG
jgi:hypothetical protein